MKAMEKTGNGIMADYLAIKNQYHGKKTSGKDIPEYMELKNRISDMDALQSAALSILESAEKPADIRQAMIDGYKRSVWAKKQARHRNKKRITGIYDQSGNVRHDAADGSHIMYRHVKESIAYCLALLPIQRHRAVLQGMLDGDTIDGIAAIVS